MDDGTIQTSLSTKLDSISLSSEAEGVKEDGQDMRLYPCDGQESVMRTPGEPYLDQKKQKILLAQLEAEKIKQKANDELADLVQKTGMPVTQENGQRRYGPPRYYTGPPPPKGSEVFIGKIPRDAFEPELVPLFEEMGRIYEMRIMMDFSGLNRGYCFIQYYNPQDARNAIIYLNNFELRPGRPIGVVKSVDNCRLYCGGIPKEKTRENIFEEMNRITAGVVRVIVYPEPNDKSKNRGFAFIEYESHRAAAMARRKMIPGKIPMWGVDVNVDWAQPEPDVLTLLVKNLTARISEEQLEDLFNEHSNNGVLGVVKSEDSAYVNFIAAKNAEQARRTLHNTLLDGSRIFVYLAKSGPCRELQLNAEQPVVPFYTSNLQFPNSNAISNHGNSLPQTQFGYTMPGCSEPSTVMPYTFWDGFHNTNTYSQVKVGMSKVQPSISSPPPLPLCSATSYNVNVPSSGFTAPLEPDFQSYKPRSVAVHNFHQIENLPATMMNMSGRSGGPIHFDNSLTNYDQSFHIWM